MIMANRTIFSILALCILGTAAALTLAFISPPSTQPADAPATIFSAGQAMHDLAIISREPHTMGGSQAHAEVRDYLLAEIRGLGLEPQIQKTFGLRVVYPGWITAGAVENVLVRLPGSDPDGAILLMAHYDTSPGVPGAADNGSGVVTILEILRAVRAGPTLKHDLIFLFTDGEEPGTIGAHAFVDQHPWFHDTKFAINLDTVTDAPPTLGSTSAGNFLSVLALAKTATHPAFASLPYHLFPGGDMDLLPFEQSGTPGANFYSTGGCSEFHTVLDLPAIVNPDSIQQTGDQLLGMVRYLGERPSLDIRAPDRTFFPALGRLVHYPTNWAMPLAILAGLCFSGSLFYGFYTRKLTWRGLGLGFLTLIISLGLSLVIGNLLWLGIQVLHPEYGYSPLRPRLSDDYLYAIAFITLTLSVFTISIAVGRKKVSAPDLAAGALVFWMPATVAAAILVPITSYLGTWVLFIGSLALILCLSVQEKKRAWMVSGLGFLISAVMATFLWVPVINISYLAGSPQLIIMVAMAALWLAGMMPILDWITSINRWLFPAAAFLIGAGFLLAGHFLVGKDSSPPLVNPIGYWFDVEREQAFWIAYSEELDQRQADLLRDPLEQPYTDIFSEAPPFAVRTSGAPILDLSGPHLDVVDDAWANGRRKLHLQITASMNDRLYVMIPKEVRVLSLTLPYNERKALTPSDSGFVLRFDGMPMDGFELEIEVDTSGELPILLVEERAGLPSFPGMQTQPIPGTMRTPGDIYQTIPTDFTAIKMNFLVPGLGR